MRRATSPLLVLLLLLAIWTAVSSAIGAWRDFSPVPFWDQWRGYIDFYMHADSWRAYWQPHNEHRIIVSKLIFWADNRWFGGRNVLSMVANYVLLFALAASFCRIGMRYLEDFNRRLALIAVVGVIMFSWVQWENLTWAFQNQWYAVSLFALLAFACLERGRDWRWLIGSIVCALLSMCSMANGLLAFPILVAMALYLRLGWERVLALAVACALATAAYTHHLHPATDKPITYALHAMPHEVARFVVLYLGGPAWGALQSLTLSLVFGGLWLLGAALLLWMIVVCRRSPERLRAPAMGAMALFILATGLVTALGRVPLLGSGVAMASRYESAALVGWTAMLIFFAANCSTLFQIEFVAAAALAAMAVVAPYQPNALTPMADRTFRLNAGGLALRAGVFDSPLIAPLNDDHALLVKVATEARMRHLSIFSRPSVDFPEPTSPVVASRPCTGGINSIVKASPTSDLAQINGWAYEPNGSPAAHVIITDPSGNPIGYGIGGEPRAAEAASVGNQETRSGWVALFAPRPDYGVVVESRDGSLCFIQH